MADKIDFGHKVDINAVAATGTEKHYFRMIPTMDLDKGNVISDFSSRPW